MTAAGNKMLGAKAYALAKGSDGLQRRAANCAAIALSTTSSVAAARNACADLWQPDLQAATPDLIGELAAGNVTDDAPLS